MCKGNGAPGGILDGNMLSVMRFNTHRMIGDLWVHECEAQVKLVKS